MVSQRRKEDSGEYKMPKRYVLRWERNGVLESDSGKKEHWLAVAELGDVKEKVLVDFGKLFQRIGAVWLYERLDILREEAEGRSGVRWLEEWVEPAGLILIFFSEVLKLRGMKKVVSKRDDFVVDALFYFIQTLTW